MAKTASRSRGKAKAAKTGAGTATRVDPTGPRTAAGTAQFPRSGANKVPGTPKAPAAGAENSKPKDRKTGRTIEGGIRVRATKIGFYDNKRIRMGDVFTIREDRHTAESAKAAGKKAGDLVEFSKKWMRIVDGSTPEKITPGSRLLKQENAEALSRRTPGESYAPPMGGVPADDSDDVLGEDDGA